MLSFECGCPGDNKLGSGDGGCVGDLVFYVYRCGFLKCKGLDWIVSCEISVRLLSLDGMEVQLLAQKRERLRGSFPERNRASFNLNTA